MINRNNQEVAWDIWAEQGPLPFPNQTVPLNIHYPQDFRPKILVLNCGVITRPNFLPFATQFCYQFQPAILIVTNTAGLGIPPTDTCRELPFNSFMSTPLDGPGQGVYLLWRSDLIQCQGYNYNEQGFSFVVTSTAASDHHRSAPTT